MRLGGKIDLVCDINKNGTTLIYTVFSKILNLKINIISKCCCDWQLWVIINLQIFY